MLALFSVLLLVCAAMRLINHRLIMSSCRSDSSACIFDLMHVFQLCVHDLSSALLWSMQANSVIPPLSSLAKVIRFLPAATTTKFLHS